MADKVSKSRFVSLDLLRFWACVLVILSHTPIPQTAPTFLKQLSAGGGVGVDLFFVLSGYLVSGLLLKEFKNTGKINVTRFLIRRGFKIYPAFYFYLFSTTLIIMFLAKDWVNIQPSRLLPEIFFVQNYFIGTWGHTWTLAVEEHFYLLLVFGLYLSSRLFKNPFAYIPVVFIFISITCFYLRYRLAGEPYSASTHVFPTHLRLDAFSFGLLIAYFNIFHLDKFTYITSRLSLLLIALGVMLMVPAFINSYPKSGTISMYMLTINYLGAGLLLAGFLAIDKNLPWPCHWLAYLGERSYSIYLWHAVVATWVLPRICPHLDKISPHLGWITSITACLVLGTIMARLVEIPALNLRQKLFPDLSSHKPQMATNSSL